MHGMLFILGVMKPSQLVCDCTDVYVIEYGDTEGCTGRQTSMSDFFSTVTQMVTTQNSRTPNLKKNVYK
jgi:hypothetical protein